MQVKETTLNQVTVYNASVLRSNDGPRKTSSKDSASKDTKVSNASLQKEILMKALDKLENSRQLDNSLPLDKEGAEPIETYQDALKELGFIGNGTYLEQAFSAQANINPQDVFYLFAEN